MSRLVMSRQDRAALADAIRDMRRIGVRPVDMARLEVAPRAKITHLNIPRSRLRVRT